MRDVDDRKQERFPRKVLVSSVCGSHGAFAGLAAMVGGVSPSRLFLTAASLLLLAGRFADACSCLPTHIQKEFCEEPLFAESVNFGE